MAIRCSQEVNWNVLREKMMYPFVHYDWDSGEVFDLSIETDKWNHKSDSTNFPSQVSWSRTNLPTKEYVSQKHVDTLTA